MRLRGGGVAIPNLADKILSADSPPHICRPTDVTTQHHKLVNLSRDFRNADVLHRMYRHRTALHGNIPRVMFLE